MHQSNNQISTTHDAISTVSQRKGTTLSNTKSCSAARAQPTVSNKAARLSAVGRRGPETISFLRQVVNRKT